MSTNPYQPPSFGPPASDFGLDPVKQAIDRLKIPAITLLVMAAITAVLRIGGLVLSLMNMGQAQGQNIAFGTGEIVGNGAALLFNIATVAGAYKMMRAESYSAAMTAAIISVIPVCSPCLLLGIPFGIWAIVILVKPEVKAAFRP